MNVAGRIFAVAALGLFLSACSLLGGIIGPQPVTDPLGVENLGAFEVTPDLITPTSMISTLASQGEVTVDAVFEDQDPVDLQGFTPDEIVEHVGLENTVTVENDSGVFPDSFSLVNPSLDITLSDATGNIEANETFEGSLEFTKSDICTATSCEYAFSGTSVNIGEVWTFVISNADEAYTLVTSGGENTLSATLHVTTNSNPELAGGTLTLELAAGDATISVR